MAYQNILVEKKEAVGLITLNRPDALNALNKALMDELTLALDAWEADAAIHCIVITGSQKAFAAGADIKEMQPKSYMDVYKEDFITANWERVTRCRSGDRGRGRLCAGRVATCHVCDFIICATTPNSAARKQLASAGRGRHAAPYPFVGKSKAWKVSDRGA